MIDANLQYLKNWNGYMPAVDTGELKEFELSWKVLQHGVSITMSKKVSMTQENYNYITKYLQCDTDVKVLRFLANCDENGIGNAIEDRKNELLVSEVAGESIVIGKILQLNDSFEPTAEESRLYENTPGGYENLLKATQQAIDDGHTTNLSQEANRRFESLRQTMLTYEFKQDEMSPEDLEII